MSRLRKKLATCNLHLRIADQARQLAALQELVAVRPRLSHCLILQSHVSILRQHGIAVSSDTALAISGSAVQAEAPRVESRKRPATPPTSQGPQPTPRKRGRPSKQAQLAAQAQAVALEAASLRRELSVTDGGVCLCHDRPTTDMVHSPPCLLPPLLPPPSCLLSPFLPSVFDSSLLLTVDFVPQVL